MICSYCAGVAGLKSTQLFINALVSSPRFTQSLALRRQGRSLRLIFQIFRNNRAPARVYTYIRLCNVSVTLRSGKIIVIEKNYTPHLYNSCEIGIPCGKDCDLIAFDASANPASTRCRQTQTITIDFLSGDQSSSPLTSHEAKRHVKGLAGDLLWDPLKDYLRHRVRSHSQQLLFKSTDI